MSTAELSISNVEQTFRDSLISEIRESESKNELLIVGHTYQPHREAWIPSTKSRLYMATEANDLINSQVYEPLFEITDRVPDGIFSYWAPLRDWKMKHTPQGYQTAIEHLREVPDKEYQILGDTYMHIIMPLQTPEDQDMLIKIGKQAFENDFGFSPKGVWLAETAVSQVTIDALYRNGYEYVVLRDSQIENTEQNPVYVPVYDSNEEVGELAVVHFDSGLSGSVSFDSQTTENADQFLDRVSASGKRTVTVGSDTELYGHHKPDRDKFLKYVTRKEVLSEHGYSSYNVKDRLAKEPYVRTTIKENSSWSCDHQLGRWTGDCNCDNPSPEAIHDKKTFYDELTQYGHEINNRLDLLDPQWREKFVSYFLAMRSSWFGEGNPEEETKTLIESGDETFKNLHNEQYKKLFEAKMCELVGKTSCGWFFGETDRPERELPRVMIGEIKNVLYPFERSGTIFE